MISDITKLAGLLADLVKLIGEVREATRTKAIKDGVNELKTTGDQRELEKSVNGHVPGPTDGLRER